MDAILAGLPAVQDGDLMLCSRLGVAYQREMRAMRVDYDQAYLDKCRAYETDAIALAVVEGRIAMLQRHLHSRDRVLDVGVGSGAFMRAARGAGFVSSGYDVISSVVVELRRRGEYSDQPAHHDACTFWDSLEHMEKPAGWLEQVRRGPMQGGPADTFRHPGKVFISLPIFEDLAAIRASKHYRPGEHLYYWTARGLARWMRCLGYRLLESSSHETAAGREQIGAFAFVRDLTVSDEASARQSLSREVS